MWAGDKIWQQNSVSLEGAAREKVPELKKTKKHNSVLSVSGGKD